MPPSTHTFAAIDLGASSGRVVAGEFDGARVELREVHRFPNPPVRLPDGLHWNLLELFSQALDGARRAGDLRSVAVDSWGVDYALLDERDRVLGLPYHYRDTRTRGMAAVALARVRWEDLYAVTGTQQMAINTVFQLLAEEGSGTLTSAHALALIPDLLGLWLSGTRSNEATVASTTGLLDARTGTWSMPLIAALGLPQRPFGDVIEPGTVLGSPLPTHELRCDSVVAVASHDTASAFVAAPVEDEHAAVLSCGTWSLLGIECTEPILSAHAREANLTNERGIDGTIRLLKNVMGLWLEQECARHWGLGFDELAHLSSEAHAQTSAPVALFDPDDEALLLPGDMPARIERRLAQTNQPIPGGPGALVHAIHLSLACRYRWVLERLEAVSGRQIATIHLVGGGVLNRRLVKLTADITGRTVLAGPVEAAALGNVLVQARAVGALGPLRELREVVRRSIAIDVHEPGPETSFAQDTYGRFVELLQRASPVPR